MIISLLSLLGGGFMRLLPEMIGLWNKKTENSHELAMMDRQLALQKAKSEDDRLTIRASGEDLRETMGLKGNIDETLALLDAQKEALRGQMQKIGIPIADAMNFLVRPITTYYFLSFHLLAKICMLVVAFQSGSSMWANILAVYTPEDAAILSGILSFWFVGRVFDKQK